MKLAGYDLIELGPRGYLPIDHSTLSSELKKRSLQAAATYVMGALESEAHWPELQTEVVNTCELLTKLKAGFLVLIDAPYTDLMSRKQLAPARLGESAWQRLMQAAHWIAEIAQHDFGLQLVFHPHAETHVEYEEDVERFLQESDPSLVGLCLDTGHHAYRGGDPVAFLKRHHKRIPYLHLKSVDAEVIGEVNRENMPFSTAVERGVFCEPARGSIDFKAVSAVLRDTSYDGVCIVEQDQYPADPAAPLPIAKRTLAYLRQLGFE
jgi:inosose dehydratase